MTPAWILAAIAALMLVVAAVSTVRLVAAKLWRLDSGARVSLATAGPVGAVDMTVLPGIQSRPAPPPGTAPADAAPDTDQAASVGEEHCASPGAGAAGTGGPHRAGGRGFLLSPDVTVGCRITMSVAMAVMLLIAL